MSNVFNTELWWCEGTLCELWLVTGRTQCSWDSTGRRECPSRSSLWPTHPSWRRYSNCLEGRLSWGWPNKKLWVLLLCQSVSQSHTVCVSYCQCHSHILSVSVTVIVTVRHCLCQLLSVTQSHTVCVSYCQCHSHTLSVSVTSLTQTVSDYKKWSQSMIISHKCHSQTLSVSVAVSVRHSEYC